MNGKTEIQLSDERKKIIVDAFKKFFLEQFDDDISDFKADQVIDFFLNWLGPNIYNQAIQDARSFVIQKLEDLDVEFYYPEDLT